MPKHDKTVIYGDNLLCKKIVTNLIGAAAEDYDFARANINVSLYMYIRVFNLRAYIACLKHGMS